MIASKNKIKKSSVSKVMLQVIIALIPAILCISYFYGINYIFIITNSITCALLSEYAFLKLRKENHEIILTKLKDLSAVVTAILFSLCLPPNIPWYIVSFGIIFAIVISKQLYGGLGQNIFNPAMVGYCVVLISLPVLFTSWPLVNHNENYDSITSATPLETIKSQTKNNQTIEIIKNNHKDIFLSWNLINLSYLLGGLYLIYKKIIKVFPSLSYLLTIGLASTILSSIWPDNYADGITNLFTGSTMIAAFFIITDPVTMPASFKNKIIYSSCIAFLTYLIRIFGGYPDGVAFAVILMNAAVPLLDKINIPKPFGVK